MSFIANGYEQLCNLIIRPPRFNYDISDLGDPEFYIGRVPFKRTDVDLKNKRGLVIKASHYHPKNQQKKAPCVIYCHGNCGSRMDARDSLHCLLPFCTVFCMDFTGSGLSEGQYVSLGFFEKEDLTAAVEYLRATDTVTTIGLWGRSMGAATSIFYGIEDPSIAGMVLDSCYSSLAKVSEELVQRAQSKIPKMLVGLGLKMVRSTIKSKAKFDINSLEPCKFVHKCFIPALFAHGSSDSFILPHHTETLYAKYAGDKNLIMVDGDHNSPRPDFFYDSVAIFFHNTLIGETPESSKEPQNVVEVKYPSKETVEQKRGSEDSFFSIPFGNPMLPLDEDDEDAQLQEALKESLKVSGAEPKLDTDHEQKVPHRTTTTTTTTTNNGSFMRSSHEKEKPNKNGIRPDLRASTERKNSREKKTMPTVFPAEDFL